LLIIGSLPFLFSSNASINVLLFFLFFYYFFGSIAGPAWNSWMKDLVPEESLGSYFSKRTRYTQTLNVILSLLIALMLDYIKQHYPQFQLRAYATMFVVAGLIGITGAMILSKAPEPQSHLPKENIFNLFKRPLKDGNFRRLLVFNSAWVFALNIATPFFTVFLLKSVGLPLSYIIILGIVGQLSSIATLRMWGTFADRYSNKTIIAISAPVYILVFIAWCFVGIYKHMYMNEGLLFLIYVFTGISTAGINLSLTNIGLKLAPKEDAIVYLSTKNIITAFFSTLSPLVGGYLADFFIRRHLNVTAQWGGPKLTKTFRLIELHEWNFLFVIAALLALFALELLMQVKETGEVEKEKVVRILRTSIKSNLKEYFLIGHLLSLRENLWSIIKRRLAHTESE
jgi:MFS family permease